MYSTTHSEVEICYSREFSLLFFIFRRLSLWKSVFYFETRHALKTLPRLVSSLCSSRTLCTAFPVMSLRVYNQINAVQSAGGQFVYSELFYDLFAAPESRECFRIDREAFFNGASLRISTYFFSCVSYSSVGVTADDVSRRYIRFSTLP